MAVTAVWCVTVGLRIEEGTAKFYLDVAEGNLKDAIALYGKPGILPPAAAFLLAKMKGHQ